jgi:hypothetical protein
MHKAVKAIGVVFLILLVASIARVVSVNPGTTIAPAPASAIAAPVTTKSLADQRKEYAADVDRRFLDGAIESRTEARGTTLVIHSAAAGRVFAQKLDEALPFERLEAMGFRRVVLTDDYHSTFTWKIPPAGKP